MILFHVAAVLSIVSRIYMKLRFFYYKGKALWWYRKSLTLHDPFFSITLAKAIIVQKINFVTSKRESTQ